MKFRAEAKNQEPPLHEPNPNSHQFRLIVFNIEKNPNVALLLRSAYAFGCKEFLIVGRQRFRFTGASGAHRFQPIRHCFTLQEAVDYCRDQGDEIVGVEIGGEALSQTTFLNNTAFILGNEGRGLADAETHCDRLVTIPQWRGMPSLNVATAGSIVMYDFMRRQDHPVATSDGQRYVDAAYPIHKDKSRGKG